MSAKRTQVSTDAFTTTVNGYHSEHGYRSGMKGWFRIIDEVTGSPEQAEATVKVTTEAIIEYRLVDGKRTAHVVGFDIQSVDVQPDDDD